MYLDFSPVRIETHLSASRTGDILTVNGEAFDLSGIPEGAILPADAIDSHWFAGPVERIGGVLHVTLMLPHGAHAPQETLFPAALVLTGDGAIALPAYEVSHEQD